MNPAETERRCWSRARWLIACGVVMAMQVALILALADRSNPKPRPIAPAPLVQLFPVQSNEFLLLNDPTLFALPHREGFSGVARIRKESTEFQPTNWAEEPKWLALAPAELGGAFRRYMESNTFRTLDVLAASPPELILPVVLPARAAATSRVKLTGELASFNCDIASLALPALTNADPTQFSNTVLRVAVGPRGNTFSVTPVSRSGATNLVCWNGRCVTPDDLALTLAKSARFQPGYPPDGRPGDSASPLTFGNMIFEWQAVAAADLAGSGSTP